MAKITKEDLSEVLAKKTGLSKNKAGDYLNTLLDEIKKSLSQGKKVTLTGFGTFRVSQRKARKGRNPQTGEEIQIPAMKVARFKAGKGLKEAVK